METSNPQQGYAWLLDRVGCATASRFKDVMDRLKTGKPSAACRSYALQLVTERLTGQPTEHYVTPAMQWGTDNEGPARELYQELTGNDVTLVGFQRHPELAAGASPDGCIGLDGLVEFKAPTSQTHIATLIGGMDPMHQYQVQGQMWITGCDWCDFVSFDPRLPNRAHRIYIQRVPRDEAFIADLEAGVRLFLADVDATISSLMEKTK